MCQELGWLVNIEKSELDPRQVFDFVGYQFDLKSGRVRPTPDRWQTLQQKIQTLLSWPACLVRQFIVLDRSANSHREASSPRPATHEAHSMASQKQLEGSGITRKGHSHPQISASQSEVVAGGRQFTSRPTITPSKALSANLYRCIKRRVGWSLKWAYCKRNLVPSRKQTAYKLSRTKSNLPSIERVSRPLLWQDTVVLYINKEGGMRSGPLCALLWRILTWCTRKQVSLRARHIPGRLNVVADKLSRLGQTIQTQWSLHPEVFQAICSRWHWPQIDLFAMRFNKKLPLFVSPVLDPLASAVDALSLTWEDLDAYASHQQSFLASGGEAAGLPMQENHSDRSRVAQHVF